MLFLHGRQARGAKLGKAFSEFACLFISLLEEGATVQDFISCCKERKKKRSSKLRIKTTHWNLLVKLTAVSWKKNKKEDLGISDKKKIFYLVLWLCWISTHKNFVPFTHSIFTGALLCVNRTLVQLKKKGFYSRAERFENWKWEELVLK